MRAQAAKRVLGNFVWMISEQGVLDSAVACALESSLHRLTVLLQRR